MNNQGQTDLFRQRILTQEELNDECKKLLDILKCCGNCKHISQNYESIECSLWKRAECRSSRLDEYRFIPNENGKGHRPLITMHYKDKPEDHWELCDVDNYFN